MKNYNRPKWVLKMNGKEIEFLDWIQHELLGTIFRYKPEDHEAGELVLEYLKRDNIEFGEYASFPDRIANQLGFVIDKRWLEDRDVRIFTLRKVTPQNAGYYVPSGLSVTTLSATLRYSGTPTFYIDGTSGFATQSVAVGPAHNIETPRRRLASAIDWLTSWIS